MPRTHVQTKSATYCLDIKPCFYTGRPIPYELQRYKQIRRKYNRTIRK